MNENGQTDSSRPVGVVASRGYTLVELVIVMAIFMAVIIISSQAFNNILSMSAQQTKSSESDTQGVIGLEMLRVDLEHAGYGLPWLLSFPAEFDEGKPTVGAQLPPGINLEDFNDKYNTTSDTNKVPRAIQAGTSTTNGRDYLVIKSLLAGMSDATKKWTFVQGAAALSTLKVWGVNDFIANEKVITIDAKTKRLIGSSTTATDFSYTITTAGMTPPASFQPQLDSDVYVVYGALPATNSSALRAPYNRVDYFVMRPTTAGSMPSRCASGTGILYKAVMNHGDLGGFTQLPLLECVADMQIVFNVAADGTNGVDVNQGGLTGLSAKEIRQQLKMVKIYIVAHEGGRDTGFTYASQTLNVGAGSGRVLDLKNDVVGSNDYKFYRWKIYTLIVTPKNINY